MYGRHLAGFGEVQDEAAEPTWAANELDLLAHMDDVKNNGVFDAPGTKPNLYRDAGVFAGRFGVPGYIDREKSYKLSEIIDSTTGRPVVYVPSGAVSMDSAAQVAFIEQGQYAPPRPLMDSQSGALVRSTPTWDVMQNPKPVPAPATDGLGQLPFGLSWDTAAVIAGVLAVAGGVAYVALSSPKVQSNRRRRRRY